MQSLLRVLGERPQPVRLLHGRGGAPGGGQLETQLVDVSGFIGNRVRNGVLWLCNARGQVCAIRASNGACVKWGGGKAPAPPHQGPICWGVAPDGKTLYLAGWKGVVKIRSKVTSAGTRTRINARFAGGRVKLWAVGKGRVYLKGHGKYKTKGGPIKKWRKSGSNVEFG